MQISRHWRMNSQRYRLEGIRYQNGEMSLQNRPVPAQTSQEEIIPVQIKSTKQDIQPAVAGAA